MKGNEGSRRGKKGEEGEKGERGAKGGSRITGGTRKESASASSRIKIQDFFLIKLNRRESSLFEFSVEILFTVEWKVHLLRLVKKL